MSNQFLDILSDAEMLRYSRQISIRSMDIEGQEKLKLAKVLIIGVGGLGCTVAQYLAVAGLGHLTLVDHDKVDISNLQRQVLHQDNDVGQYKVISAKESLKKANPNTQIETLNKHLDDEEMEALVCQHNLVLDCTDNVMVREQLNQACFNHKVPLVSGAAIRMEGMVSVFNYDPDNPCYHCYSQLFGEQQLSCVESGILAPVVGLIGCIQATEAIKILVGMGQALIARLLLVDAMTMEIREMKIPKKLNCPVCG